MSTPEGDSKTARKGMLRQDQGGRAVWEWAIDSGRQALDSTSRLLRKLDLSAMRQNGGDASSGASPRVEAQPPRDRKREET
jgi:hypothetical protein